MDARWILATLLIFASLLQSEAFQWEKQPNKPTIVVQDGVRNKNVKLEWKFILGVGESLSSVIFKRKNADALLEDSQLASQSVQGNAGGKFTVSEKFKNEYTTELPATLIVLDANNDQEYVYTVDVSYHLSGGQLLEETSHVTVIVHVPPRITVEPIRRSEVNAGQNVRLTCNASGDPMPNITWTREGVPQNQFNATGYALHLVNVQRKDVGSYRCIANNGYGTATSLAIVNVNCPANQCSVLTVGINLTSVAWIQAYSNKISVEYKRLTSNLSSAIVSLYTLPQNAGKQLFELAIAGYRPGSTVAVVQLQFQKEVADPLKPLRDDVADGTLGPFKVGKQLDLNPTPPPSATPTGTITASSGTPDTSTSSALTQGELAGIITGSIAFVIIIVIVILIYCIRKNKNDTGGPSKGKSFSEADGYRMNKRPPPSGLGTASPAYVEARMYAPPDAGKNQDDLPKKLNYADTSSTPASGGGGKGGQQGEGGFELWC